MAIQNKNDLKQLSNTTYIDNTQGLIRPQDVRYFNDTLIDSLVDETDYSMDSGSWNSAISSMTASIVNIINNTGSFVLNSQTASMSVATASYVDLRGDGITVNYGNGWIELTGSTSTGNASVIVSDTAPTASLYPSGTLWFNSVNTSMYVNNWDGVTYNWIGIGASGPVISASYSITASYSQTASYFFTASVTSASLAQSASWVKTAQTASYFLTSSVTSASRAELAGEALWYYTASVTNATYASTSSFAQRINVTGSRIGVTWNGEELQLTGSTGGSQVFQGDTPPVSVDVTTGSLWYNTTNGGLYVMYVDQNSSQWVSVNAIGPVTSASYAGSASLASTASYINVTGSNVIANWNGSQLQLTGSADATVIVSDTAPIGAEEGTQWFNSITTNLYVYYNGAWVGTSASGPVVSSSYSITSSHSITASSALYAQSGGNQNLQSVTSFGNTTSQSIDIRDRLIVNITGSGTLTQGQSVEARGDFSHAQGYDTWASGDHSHAEGDSTSAYGESSHAEGSGTVTIDAFSHAEGEGSVADGVGSHAEGYGTRTVGRGSHSEGSFTLAEGDYSHAEGISTHAIGNGSNASGLGTVTQGIASDTRGRYTNAGNDYQSVVGQWNIPLTSTDNQGWFIIGDGTGLPGHPKQLHNLFMAGDGKIIISGTLDISGSILGFSSSAPQVPYIAGPGIIINDYQISSSVLTVNGVSPDPNGNIATALTNVITGTSGSLIISSSGDATGSLTEGTVWVVSGMTGSASASNGVSYIWDGNAPGQWLKLSSLDIVTADQRYVIQSPSTVFLGTASLALVAQTASYYDEKDTLQSVTTRNNRTTRSVIIGDATATATGANSLALGSATLASGQQSLAGGIVSNATNRWSLAFGEAVNAYGQSAVAMNAYTEASGAYSFAIGHSTKAIGLDSHAEGAYSTAIGVGSHAEGGRYIPTDPGGNFAGGTAIGNASHAEGRQTSAVGVASHAEGISTIASGYASHAEGEGTIANGNYSHAEGVGTIAQGAYSHAQGKYNIGLADEGAFVVGNGSSNASRSNLLVAAGNRVSITGSLAIQNSTGTPTNAVVAAGFVRGVVNGVQVFFPYYI